MQGAAADAPRARPLSDESSSDDDAGPGACFNIYRRALTGSSYLNVLFFLIMFCFILVLFFLF